MPETVDWLAALIAGAPNIVIAIWVIWRDGKTMEKLLQQQQWILEQLMKLHPPQDEPAVKVVEKK